MYSSDTDYLYRRAKAEQEARSAGQKATLAQSVAPPPCSSEPSRPAAGGLSHLFSRLKDDDLLILALLFLILNESDQEDPLMVILLAALLFS